ncbi:RNA-binding protein [Hanstruepera neustonica]|uniref:RNA-binding protein n=1 Tax=Hanstruepera neustonica TaxID=1445657 RepID=A0A2K1DXS3_9FLAO|nr:FG-GAP-like repeat-containing protein [Hanstruepera neustonica]PNQ72836.1 RNA-binding protein [Hanstruepera neustonica]
MNKKLLLALGMLPMLSIAQITFTNSNTLLVNASLTSGCAIGVSDMNGDGLDDIIRLDDARNLQIEYQTAGGGNFTQYNFGSVGGSQWGLAIADVDENGYNDVITGGAYNGVKVIKANSDGSLYTSTTLAGSIFMQNVNFADIDNNGSIDIFACHDDGVSVAYGNDGSGNFSPNNGLINAVSTIPSDNSGNYGSIWADVNNDGHLDLYISKCRLGVNDPNDGRRVNLLFMNDGTNNYTDEAATRGLAPLGQSWSANFEDIDNDGDLDCVLINHDITSMIFVNDGTGNFTDITPTCGITGELASLGSGGIQVVMEDFDNDTFIDIFITMRSGIHHLFKNDGDKTFTEVSAPFTLPTGPSRIQSAAVGDLNNDGFIDVMAGFATGYNGPSSDPDVLYLNDGNTNNWSEIRLIGDASNINGIGARIEIQGAWGSQIREVRSGESYGTMNSLMTHFGLGTATEIDAVVVHWPSGSVDTVSNPNINEVLVIEEGQTLSTESFSSQTIHISPNPTNDILNIETTSNGSFSYAIYDLSGKQVQTETVLPASNQININHLSNGIYIMQLTSQNSKTTHKIIKE